MICCCYINRNKTRKKKERKQDFDIREHTLTHTMYNMRKEKFQRIRKPREKEEEKKKIKK